VVVDQQSRTLPGMITDRDLCCSIIAQGRDPGTQRFNSICGSTSNIIFDVCR
jgi:hypothetical protein